MNKNEKFIANHKGYFERNKEFITNNDWHHTKTKTGKVDKPKAELARIATKLEGLKSDDKLVKNILNRLSAFLKIAAGDRHKKPIQDFIDDTVDIAKFFISKCDLYIEDNDFNKITDSTIKDAEIELQDEVFNRKISIHDKLDSLDIDSEVDNLQIKFYGEETRASLILKSALSLKIPDVKRKIEALGPAWDIMNSNEMFINMNPKDVPQWNDKKNFFDQDTSTLQFWNEEFNKITNGINIGGYFIHPWLYFHLNFFKTPIPISQNEEPVINPYLRDNEWFFVENLKLAEDAGDKGLLMYGSRRISKSVILASYIHWKSLVKFNSVATVTGGSEGDLADLVDKITTSMSYIEPAFKLDAVKQNWDGGNTILGIKKNASTIIKHSIIAVKNLAAGAKKSTQKTAGGAPSAFVNDEIGKYDFLKSYLAAIPSFETPFGYKCVPILAGTGGEADLSVDAVKVLKNPAAYKLLPMQWDLLESKIDPDFITWKRRVFATYYPGQMTYKAPKKEKRFSDFLGIESKKLDRMPILVTQWDKAKESLDYILEEEIATVKGADRRLLEQQHKVQYPTDPEDCFISVESNPFLPTEVKVHKDRIVEEGDTGKKAILYRQDGRIKYDIAETKPLPEFPFQGGFIDSPVVIFIEPPEGDVEEYLFIASLDDYKQEKSDGDSVGSFTIYRRNNLDKDSLKIAAVYDSRPDPHRKFHEQGLMLLEMYNAKCFPENEDMDFKIYTDTRNVTWRYLVKGLNLAQDLDLNANGNREFGWAPTTKNIAFGMGLLTNYVTEELTTFDENGEVSNVVRGLTRIKSVGLLEELQGHKKDGNFDRTRSFMGCLMYDHYLTSIHIIPRQRNSADKEQHERKKKAKLKSHPMFANSRGKFF